MAFKSILKIEKLGLFVSFVFYAVIGIVFLAAIPLTDLPPHVGIIGILSLITAYGLMRKRVWTIWLVIMLFFIATTFSAITLYSFFGKDILYDISITAYLVLTWIFTAYIATKRKTLES